MDKRATDEELAREAAEWADGTRTLKGWDEAPQAIPAPHMTIDIRLPVKMVDIIQEMARRKGLHTQDLIRIWLRDRIEQEARPILERRQMERELLDAVKGMEWPPKAMAEHPRTSPVFHEAGEK